MYRPSLTQTPLCRLKSSLSIVFSIGKVVNNDKICSDIKCGTDF